MLFQPLSLRSGLTLKNRLVVAPMTTYSSYEDGTICEDELPYLHRRARSGFGAVMTAACFVHRTGKAFDGQWGCESDARLPSLRLVADAIHAGGAAAILQIHHGGRQAPSRLCDTPLSASAIPAERPNAETPTAMSLDQIDEIVDAFGQAARRAKEAGFDGVEIHGANTYLLQQFVSPHSNRREDEYGLDRNRFSVEVSQAVFAAVGPNYSVGYRFSPEEIETPGIRLSETLSLLDSLKTMPFDYFHASLRDYRMSSLVGDFDDSILVRLVHHLSGYAPLIGVGQVKTVDDAEAVLTMGAQLVALGKVAISEPEWPELALRGDAPRLTIPKPGAEEALTLPRGLTEKIYSVPGWFEVEEKTAFSEPV